MATLPWLYCWIVHILAQIYILYFHGEYDFKIWVKVMKTQKEVRIGLQRDVVVTVGRSQNSPDQKR
jgi:hypothetical protein